MILKLNEFLSFHHFPRGTVGKVIAASISGISCRVLRGEQCYYVKLRMLTDIKSGYEMIAHVGNCILPSLFFVDAARDATRS